jgi:hypothetical protein
MGLPLEDRAFDIAQRLAQSNLVELTPEFNIFDLTDLLIKTQLERDEKNEFTDKQINYNDEIVSIEEVGELETIDISVSGDNLFYCSNILTKNSMGIPGISDFFLAIINTEELKEMGQVMFRQLKNRYSGISDDEKFILGIDTKKQKLFDLDHGSEVKDIKQSKQKKQKPVDPHPTDIDMNHTIPTVDKMFDNFTY